MEIKNIEQQPTNSTPEENGGTGNERMFSQEEVNRIVSERLARERSKAEPSPIDEREQALKAGENRLNCREYVSDEGYPQGLLEILDTSDFEAFKNQIQQLDELLGLPSKHLKIPQIVAPVGSFPSSGLSDPLRNAFAPKK